MHINVLDPSVHPIRLVASVVRVFPGGKRIVSVERPLGVPSLPQIFGFVIAQAETATVAIIGTHISIVRTHSTTFGPQTTHRVVRQDSTVAFGPNVRV